MAFLALAGRDAPGEARVLVLVGVLTALHIATPYSRAVSLAIAGSSLTVVWLGVALTH